MIKISNWLRRPLSIQIPGFNPGVVPPAVDDGINVRAGVVRVTSEHYSALLALDSQDVRRRDLALAEVRADDGTATDHLVPSVPSVLSDPTLAQQRRIAEHLRA